MSSEKSNTPISYSAIRPVMFLLLFAVAMSFSFLPLYMAEIYKPLFGLAKKIVIGLPLSAELFCTVLVLIPCSIWVDKRGWHEPFLIGIVVTALGILLSGFAIEPLAFILYRGIVGAGFGLAWMSAQGFVIANTDATTKARGMSSLVAGVFAGTICGSAVGAMLADRIGYTTVFLVAAAFMILPFLFAILFMRDTFIKPPPHPIESPALQLSTLLRFLGDRNIFALFFLNVMPASLCFVAVLYYITPVYLHDIGISQSNIGRAIMIYGLCMIYIAPLISRFVDRSPNKKIFIMLNGLFGGFGLVSFYFFDGFPATVFMIFMLGIGFSFGFAAQTVFVLSLKITHDIGATKVLSTQRMIDKLGQMLGPIVSGGIMVAMGAEKGIAMIGVLYLLTTLLLAIVAQQPKSTSVP